MTIHTFRNFTPHTIFIMGETPELKLVPLHALPSEGVARCSSVSTPAGKAIGVPLATVSFGAVTGLPEPQEGVLLVVSALVRGALPGRADLASPGDMARDGLGNVVGCRSLIVNEPLG